MARNRSRHRMWTKQRKSFIHKMYSGGPVYCAWCMTDIPKKFATIEHATPVVAGGSNRRSNLLVSCGPCNWQRGRDFYLPIHNARAPYWEIVRYICDWLKTL